MAVRCFTWRHQACVNDCFRIFDMQGVMREPPFTDGIADIYLHAVVRLSVRRAQREAL